jgi:long-chain acyl-CoA synthetase
LKMASLEPTGLATILHPALERKWIMSVHSFTVYDMFKRNARLYRDKTAIISEDQQITFGELFDQINRVAGGLAANGVRKGDRIAVLSKNCPEFFTLMGAVAAVGAIMVPINFRLAANEIGHVLNNTEPVMLFFERDFEPIVSEISAGCPSVKHLITFYPSDRNFRSFDSFTQSKPGKAIQLSGSDPFMIIHTAAVLGKARGGVLSHDNFTISNTQQAAMMGLTGNDAYLNILPIFHVAGLGLALAIMHMGGKNVLISKFDPKAAIKMVSQERVTIIGDFPPILTQLLDEQSAGEYSLSSLKHVLGLESQDTIERFESTVGGQFWLAYGQTETMGQIFFCPNKERPGSAGRPGPLVALMIVDEFDREVSPGESGEILIRGPIVFQGYWKEEELTEHTLRGGWHHTGDLGRADNDGYLWFMGRKAEKELIKTGGENVYPVEVEKTILQHPAVKEVAVIGVADSEFAEAIKAICVLKPDCHLTEAELIDFVGKRIARYKRPKYAIFVDALPRTKEGSIDREQVKAKYST